MAPRHRTTTLFVVLLALGCALLSGDALPRGYQTRSGKSHRCSSCSRDCPEKLAGGTTAQILIEYPQEEEEEEAKPQFVAIAQPPASGPHPTPAPYVYTVLQPQPQYAAAPPQAQPQYSNPPSLPYVQYSAPPAQPQYSAAQPQIQYSAPAPQPQYSDPQPQPQYSAAQPQFQYSAPQPQPQYSDAQPQPQYSVAQPQYSDPRPQAQYSDPQPQPQYAVAQPEPQYSDPQPKPQYSTPSSTPRYAGHMPASRPDYPEPRPPSQSYQPIEKRPVYPPANNYLTQIRPPCGCPDCPQNFDPYDSYSGYDYEYGGDRYGRSLDSDDGYPMFGKYNRRSVDIESKTFAPGKEFQEQPLPFADESGPPAGFYKNYRPYVRESNERREYESEEQPSRRNADTERERLFVVYRADENGDNPSDSELESVIRQAMDVARQQKTQENFAKARKPKSINRYRYEHEKYQDSAVSEPVNFEPLEEKKIEANDETRFNLSPGPLMNDETFVTEDGDDTLNPGTDQSKWTVVPSLTDLDLAKPQMDDVEEIEAAVSVVPEPSKMNNVMKVPKVVPRGADVGDVKEKPMKETIEVVKADEVEKKAEMLANAMEDMQTPEVVTEATKFERAVESSVTWAPTTNTSVP